MLTTDLSNQFALVTGATGGIGKATCLALAALGCNIAVHYHSAESDGTALAKELRETYNVQADAYQADMGDYDSVRKLYKTVTERQGYPTILFNNAGINGGKSGVNSITDIDVDVFEKTWRANCGSQFLLTQLCIPEMEKKGWGRVVFCSSVAGFTGGVVGPHYASSKSALHGLIHWLAGAYAKKGITVNGIAPALIEQTKMLPGSNEDLAKKIPIGRLGTPDEIAETVIWMVKTGYVNNKVVSVDGGWYAQ